MNPERPPRILTNMTYWQSPDWMLAADSIHPGHGRDLKASPSPLAESFALFARRSRYDVIHTMGIRESLLYALLCLVTALPSRQVMTEIFLDDERKESAAWRMKNSLQKLLVRRSLGVITNSRAEIPALARRLELPENRFRFVPLNSTIPPEAEPLPGDGSVVAAGRSWRDYDTLLRAAAAIPAPIVIMAGADDIPGGPLPPNVRLLHEVQRDDYLAILRRASLCVLPLRETFRPVGQVVLLEAMAFGKPVVASSNVGTVDYIRDGWNGILVPPANPGALAQAVADLLADPARSRALARRALETVRQEHTDAIHTARRLQAIRELLG